MLKQLIHDLRIYTESVKVQITSAQEYTYPDVLVAPDPRDLESTCIKKYPSVIFEVISKTSHIDDTADKFIRYKNIDSLQNYILVDSKKISSKSGQNKKMANGPQKSIFPPTPDPDPRCGIRDFGGL